MSIKVKLNSQIGANKFQVEFDAEDTLHFFWKSEQFFNFPRVCEGQVNGVTCGGVNLYPNPRSAKDKSGNDCSYYEVKCHDCEWRFAYGQARVGGRLFPKGWQPPYVADSENPGPM